MSRCGVCSAVIEGFGEPYPWREEVVLQHLYWEDNLTTREICTELGCANTTVLKWMDRNEIERRPNWEPKPREEKPWRDEERLKDLYLSKGHSLSEIGDRLGCSRTCVREWLEEFGISTRDIGDSTRMAFLRSPPQFRTVERGYEQVRTKHDYDEMTVYIHRLAAVAWFGYQMVAGRDVHHLNGIPWDNRESNLLPISKQTHGSLHYPERQLNEEGDFAA